MKEKILAVLVVASLILSVFNLVLILNITEPTTAPTAEVYASNMTRTVLTINHAQSYTYDFAIVNPTTKTVPCVITLTLSNSTDSRGFVLDYPSYHYQIFPVPPQYNYKYSYTQYGREYPLHFDYNYTTAQITIFDLLNGAIGQQTFNILTYTSPTTGQAGVILYKANTTFRSQTGTLKIDVDIGNSGTSDTQLIALYVGTSTTSLLNQTITPVPLAAGKVARITIDYNWTKGATYYFKALSSTGQTFDWPEQAPAA